jgi:GT2 family glycosyltransferase
LIRFPGVRNRLVLRWSTTLLRKNCVLSYWQGHAYLHTERNVGFGSGHNMAIGQCLTRSKYHVVVNPDISFGEEVIGELYDFMENHSDVGLVMPSIRYPDGSPQGLCKLLPTPLDLLVRRFLGRIGEALFRKLRERYELKGTNLTVPCEVPCLSGCFMFIRSAELQRIGMFDERFFMYLEDVDLCRRIGESSKCVYYPRAFVRHAYAKGSYKRFWVAYASREISFTILLKMGMVL